MPDKQGPIGMRSAITFEALNLRLLDAKSTHNATECLLDLGIRSVLGCSVIGFMKSQRGM